MPLLRLLVLATAVLAAGLAAGAQTPEQRAARLTPSPIEAATATELTGAGAATAELSGVTLSVDGTFEGLQSPATETTLHAGNRGLRGPVIAALELDGSTTGTFAAELTLSAVQAGYFRDDRLYIQLQSEENPEGLLRGWLLQPED